MRRVLALALYLVSLAIFAPSAGASHRHSKGMPVRGVSPYVVSIVGGVGTVIGELPEPQVFECSPETKARLKHMRQRHALCSRGEACADSAFAYFYDNASKGKTIYESFQAAVGELYRMNPDTPEIWSSFILIE